jgi:hypothetical protein
MQAVIGADQIVALDTTHAERHAAMRASIVSDLDGAAEPIHHQGDIQKRHRQRRNIHRRRGSNRKPVSRKNFPVSRAEAAILRHQ